MKKPAKPNTNNKIVQEMADEVFPVERKETINITLAIPANRNNILFLYHASNK